MHTNPRFQEKMKQLLAVIRIHLQVIFSRSRAARALNLSASFSEICRRSFPMMVPFLLIEQLDLWGGRWDWGLEPIWIKEYEFLMCFTRVELSEWYFQPPSPMKVDFGWIYSSWVCWESYDFNCQWNPKLVKVVHPKGSHLTSQPRIQSIFQSSWITWETKRKGGRLSKILALFPARTLLGSLRAVYFGGD